MTVARVLFLMCLVAMVAGPSAAASPSFRARGPAVSAVSDEDAWLVVAHAADVTATNTVTGLRRTFVVRPGCQARDAHRGLLLLVCPGHTPEGAPPSPSGAPGTPYVVRLRTGRMAAVPNGVLSSGGAYGGADPGWTGIGTQWLTGYLGCYHCEETTMYVNWHTGERRSSGGFLESDAPGLDTDDARLRPVSPATAARRLPYPSYERFTDALATEVEGRRVLLSRCRTGCSQAVVAADRYAWIEGRTVHGYVPGTARRTTWPIPAAAGPMIRGPFLTRNRITILAGFRGADGSFSGGIAFTAGWPH